MNFFSTKGFSQYTYSSSDLYSIPHVLLVCLVTFTIVTRCSLSLIRISRAVFQCSMEMTKRITHNLLMKNEYRSAVSQQSKRLSPKPIVYDNIIGVSRYLLRMKQAYSSKKSLPFLRR